MRNGSFEYNLVIYPPAELSEQIVEARSRFNELYGHYDRLGKPQLLLTAFYANEAMEATLVRWLQKIFREEKGFHCALNNYGAYPQGGIYLRVMPGVEIPRLVNSLSGMGSFIEPAAPGPIAKPHVLIARDLSKEVYDRSVDEYSRKHFHERFTVQELVLLRRRDQYEAFRTVQVFGLLPANNDLFNKVA